jgi:hypothetical protein
MSAMAHDQPCHTCQLCENFFFSVSASKSGRVGGGAFLFPNRSLVVVGFGFGFGFGLRGSAQLLRSPDFSSSLLSSAGAAGSHGYHIEAYSLMVSGIPSPSPPHPPKEEREKKGGTGLCSCS